MATNRFRTCTPEGDWRSFRTTVPSGVTKVIGTYYLINDTWAMCFASEDNFEGGEPVGTGIAAGKEVSMIYNAEKIMGPKSQDTGSAFLTGEFVYIDTTTKIIYNSNNAQRTCIGTCTEAASDSDDFVEFDLKGDSMTDQA